MPVMASIVRHHQIKHYQQKACTPAPQPRLTHRRAYHLTISTKRGTVSCHERRATRQNPLSNQGAHLKIADFMRPMRLSGAGLN